MLMTLKQFKGTLRPTLEIIQTLATKPKLGALEKRRLSRTLNRLTKAANEFLNQPPSRRKAGPDVKKWSDQGFSIEGLSAAELRSVFHFSPRTALTQLVQHLLGDAAASVVLESEVFPALRLSSGDVFVSLQKNSGTFDSFRKELLRAASDPNHRLKPLAYQFGLLGHTHPVQYLDHALHVSDRDAVNAAAHVTFARGMIAQGKHDAALTHFKIASEIEPRNAYYWLGMLNTHLMLPVADREARFKIAKKALDLNAYSPIGHHLAGIAYVESGHLNRALNHFSKAVKYLPHDPVFQRSLSAVHSELAEQHAQAESPEAEYHYRAALKAAKKAQKMDAEPEGMLSVADAHYQLGIHLAKANQYDHDKEAQAERHLDLALKHYKQGVPRFPTPENLRRLAYLYLLREKNAEKAWPFIHAANELEPDNPITDKLMDLANDTEYKRQKRKPPFN